MKIATWNVNSIRVRLPHLLQWIEMASPDIVLLQEIKCLDEVFPKEELEDAGYNIYTHGQKTYNGVAIISKYPVEDIQTGIPKFDDSQARYIEGYVLGKIKIASLYVPNGTHIDDPKFQYKMNFLSSLTKHIKSFCTKETFIMGGDLNILPFDHEASNPEQWTQLLGTLPEREAYFNLLQAGLVNPHHLMDHFDYSWWDYRGGAFHRNRGVKIDHFLMSKHEKALIKDVSTDKTPRSWPQPSDHAPVILEIRNA
jgi:exodeoxyribonuclease-3